MRMTICADYAIIIYILVVYKYSFKKCTKNRAKALVYAVLRRFFVYISNED